MARRSRTPTIDSLIKFVSRLSCWVSLFIFLNNWWSSHPYRYQEAGRLEASVSDGQQEDDQIIHTLPFSVISLFWKCFWLVYKIDMGNVLHESSYCSSYAANCNA